MDSIDKLSIDRAFVPKELLRSSGLLKRIRTPMLLRVTNDRLMLGRFIFPQESLIHH